MKTNNNLIKVTNTDTGEYRYFTKDSYVMLWTGISQAALPTIKCGTSRKFPYIKYEVIDGKEIKWKDINNYNK